MIKEIFEYAKTHKNVPDLYVLVISLISFSAGIMFYFII